MIHPNTEEFLRLMDMIDYKKFNVMLGTVPEMDIGQYVRSLAIKIGSNENDEYPSETALKILKEIVKRYPKERKI